MDGFRERLSGRFDRSQMRGNGYDRTPSEDRYESDRYERPSRRGASEGISQEAVNEAVTEAVTKSNREQLDVIADFFDEAKADRMESERAIIDAVSHSISEISAGIRDRGSAPAAEPATPIAVVDEQNAETLARIERIAGQNAESLNEGNEMLQRNVDSLRSNAELLGEIRSAISELVSSNEEMKSSSAQLQDGIRQSLQDIASRPAASPMQDLTIDFSSEKNEIIGAVGDNRAILNMIRQDVLNGFARNSEEENDEEKPAPLSAEDGTRMYQELEEHVHKECVKCYKNVMSALTEQSTEANKGILSSVSGLRIMVLLSLIFSALAFILGLAQILLPMLGILL